MSDPALKRKIGKLLARFHGERLLKIGELEISNPGFLRAVIAVIDLADDWHVPDAEPKTAGNFELLAMNCTRLLYAQQRQFLSIKDQKVADLARELAVTDPRARFVIQKSVDFIRPFDSEWESGKFLPMWMKQSFARLEIAHKLAAALCLTDIPDDVEVKAPWGAWSLVIPPELLPPSVDGKSIARVWCIGTEPVFIISHDGKVAGGRADDSIDRAITSLVRGACLALSDPEKFRKESRSQRAHGASGKKRHGPPDLGQAKFMLSAPVKIDLREHLTQVLSGRKGASPTVQFLVRGHWRNQAYGPKFALRKAIWVEPFWKGPEDTRVLLRQHKIDPEDPPQP